MLKRFSYRRIFGLIGVCLVVAFLAVPSGVEAQRRDSVSDIWHNSWALPGATERYLNTLAARMMLDVERQGNDPVQNNTIIQEQNITIGEQNTFGATAIGNVQETTIVDSQNVQVVHGTQGVKGSAIGATVNAAERGNASSTSEQRFKE